MLLQQHCKMKANPIPFSSTNHFQYWDVEEMSGDNYTIGQNPNCYPYTNTQILRQ